MTESKTLLAESQEDEEEEEEGSRAGFSTYASWSYQTCNESSTKGTDNSEGPVSHTQFCYRGNTTLRIAFSGFCSCYMSLAPFDPFAGLV